MIKKFFKLKLFLLAFSFLSITTVFSTPLSSYSPRVEAEETSDTTPTPTPPPDENRSVPVIEGKPASKTGPTDSSDATVTSQATQGETLEVTSTSTNLLQNGSFELGPDPGFYLPLNPGDTSINNWAVISSSVPGGGGGGIDYYGTGWVSSDGSRSLDLNGTPGVGGIYQDFTTKPGLKYVVSFDMAGHPSGLLQEMKVSSDSSRKFHRFPHARRRVFFSVGKGSEQFGMAKADMGVHRTDSSNTPSV